jgi:hypothetical protein
MSEDGKKTIAEEFDSMLWDINYMKGKAQKFVNPAELVKILKHLNNAEIEIRVAFGRLIKSEKKQKK